MASTLQKKADLTLSLMALIAGTSFLVTKVGIEEINPIGFLWWRFAFAISTMLFLWKKLKPPAGRQSPSLLKGCLLGVLLFGGVFGIALFLDFGLSVKAAFLVFSGALWVPLFERLIGGSKMSRLHFIAFLLGICGTLLLVFQEDTPLEWIDLWGLAGALFFAWYTVFNSKWAPQHSASHMTIAQFATCFLLLSLAGFSTNNIPLQLSPAAWGSVLYMGVIATGLRYGAQTWAQKHTSASHTVLLFTLEPLTATIWGVLLLQESLSSKAWIGVAFIVLGQILAKWHIWKKSS